VNPVSDEEPVFWLVAGVFGVHMFYLRRWIRGGLYMGMWILGLKLSDPELIALPLLALWLFDLGWIITRRREDLRGYGTNKEPRESKGGSSFLGAAGAAAVGAATVAAASNRQRKVPIVTLESGDATNISVLPLRGNKYRVSWQYPISSNSKFYAHI
jgi:hypothetical protein